MSETKPVQLVTVLVYVQINISHVWKFHISEIVLAPTISDMRGSTVLPKEYTVRHQWGNTHNVGGRGYSLLSVTKSPKHIHSTVHRTSITECLYYILIIILPALTVLIIVLPGCVYTCVLSARENAWTCAITVKRQIRPPVQQQCKTVHVHYYHWCHLPDWTEITYFLCMPLSN